MATSVIKHLSARHRDINNASTFSFNQSEFGEMLHTFNPYLLLVSAGVYLIVYWVNGNITISHIGGNDYHPSVSVTSDGSVITVTFPEVMYGGIKVIG